MIWRIALAVAAASLALAAPVAAEPNAAAYNADGVQISHPGWHLVPDTEEGGLERLLSIEPDDLETTQVLRHCLLERGPLPYAPGTTQATVNTRVLQSEFQYAQSPTYRSIGEIENVSTTSVDGVAVLDVMVRGRGPSSPEWMRDRTFALVSEAGRGMYYRFSCTAWREPSPVQISEMNAILASLRFER